MLPHTIRHYKTRFPSATITVFDNVSTDRSVLIAESAGCRVVPYHSRGQQDEKHLIWVRSHMWKEYVPKDTTCWVIMCDMDEWLDATEDTLQEEAAKGTTALMTQGINMVGDSQRADHSDIDLFAITKGFLDANMSKRICFQYPTVSMEYWYGAHQCFPQGHVVWSQKVYALRHYDYLGEEYVVSKRQKRWERNALSRQMGLNGHYAQEREKNVAVYREAVANAEAADVPKPLWFREAC
jgi:hypothetical protein